MRKFALFLLPLFFLIAEDNLVKFRQGVKEFEAKNFEQALKTLGEFMEENPYEPEVKDAMFFVVKALFVEKKFSQTIARANITLERYPMHSKKIELRLLTAQALYRVNAHRQAEKILLELSKKKAAHEFSYTIEKTLAFIYYDAREYKRALFRFRNSLRVLPDSQTGDDDLLRIYTDAAKILLTDAAHTNETVRYLNRALAIAEKQEPKSVRSLKMLLRKVSLRHFDKLTGLGDNSISDIRVDGDDIYVATWGAGLYRYVRSQDRLEKIALPSSQVRGLYVDFDDIYVATFDGIFHISKKSGSVESLSDQKGELKLAQKIIKDDRYLYFSTLTRGLIQYDTIKKKIAVLEKDSWVGAKQVYALDADLDTLVVGTLEKGALIYNKKTQEVTQITAGENALRSANVKAVLLDGRYVYIGAHNDGVYVYDSVQKTLTRLAQEIPFPSSIVKRDKEIYIGTSGQGIFVLDRNTNAISRIRAIDGMASDEVHVLRVEDDFLWVGYLEKGIDILYRPMAD